jgi:hypothetical protein
MVCGEKNPLKSKIADTLFDKYLKGGKSVAIPGEFFRRLERK